MDSGTVRRWYKVLKAGAREIPTIIRHTIHNCWLNGQIDNRGETANETFPSLVGEYVRKHGTSFADVRAVRGDRG